MDLIWQPLQTNMKLFTYFGIIFQISYNFYAYLPVYLGKYILFSSSPTNFHPI